MSAPKWWNVWTPVTGTLYGIRAYDPDDYLSWLRQTPLELTQHPVRPKVVFGYGGQTIRDPRVRWTEHLWGGGRYNQTAKPFADTVLGWRQDGTLDEVIAAGGVFIISQRRTIMLLLNLGEIWFAIKARRPLYNDKHNRCRRRISIAEQRVQRAIRDDARGIGSGVHRYGHNPAQRTVVGPRRTQFSPAPVRRPRAGMLRSPVAAVFLLGLGVLCLPGWPVYTAVAWIAGHLAEILVIAVLAAAGVATAMRPRTTQRRRTRSRRRR